jgi:hypothetical protein
VPQDARAGAWRSLLWPGLGLLALVAVAVVHLRSAPSPPHPPSAPPAPAAAAPTARFQTPPDLPPPPTLVPHAQDLHVPDSSELADRAKDADRATAARLADQLNRGLPLTPADVRAAQDLYDRYAAPARGLLESVLLFSAVQERARRQTDAARALLERAAAVAPDSPQPRRALVSLFLDTGDWPNAEANARRLLALDPSAADAARALGYALLRQDRTREATDALDSFLATHTDPATAALRDRIVQDAAKETSLEEQRLAHFHVRYDGEEHEAVGREILRVLERHYATLVRTFDHQPSQPIPVILLSRESYYDGTGAPAWSGGLYDSFDGRVRIPIGGLTAQLTPELDGTLMHELTHAFVTDRSHGLASREIQEGLAQFMEGKRAETMAGEVGMRALAEGRVRGVSGFYLAALSFVEYLAAQRGQGGLNDLLQAMADTGSSDGGFRRVYGKDLKGLQADWANQLRQRYGG